jgi:tetratricopeptide (TPR) repeat protein
MPSDLPQPAAYNRFDPLDEQDDVSRLPAVREPAANDNVVAPNAAAPNAAAANSGAVADIAATEAESIFNSEQLTASEAEERRAGQLLDRAFSLWERGDTAGAILACRQSLTLSPASAPAYSMLGLLLERTDDTNGAIAAYEKAVEIEPSSLLERDSARRLRASMGQALPTRFHFQEAELFDAIDGEPADDLATHLSDDTAPNTPEFPAFGSNTPLESSARAPIAAASVAASSTRLDAETSSAVATSPSSTVVASPATFPASTTSLPPTPTAPTKVATTSPSISTSGVATATTAASEAAASEAAASEAAASEAAASEAAASEAAAVRVPAAATQVTPTQMAPSQIEAPVRARPMRATLPAAAPQAAAPQAAAPQASAPQASAPQASAPQAAASTTNSAGANALENTARAATIAVPIKLAPSALATSVAAPSAVVAPIATPPMVHTGDAPSTSSGSSGSSGASSRLDKMLGSRSTFWTRSLPLMAAAGTGFLFLLWSRDIALERERRAVSTTSTTIINNASAPGAPRNSPSSAANGTENGDVVTNGIVTNGATSNSATSTSAPGAAGSSGATASNTAAPNAATSNAVAAEAGGTTAESSTQSAAQTPVVEPQIAPSGLVVSNAPSAVRRASSSAVRADSQRESVLRPSNRRAESVRTRRTFRAENQERPTRRSRYADADLAANGGSSGGSRVLRQPDVRLIPPASVPQLPRAQESSSSAANNGAGNALPPVAPSGSVEKGAGSGGLRPYAGPLPSFPSPSQVQSRAQNEIRPRPSSSASSGSTSGSARDSESAYQYQTRALTYVEQGDNASAASDFQSAMALYRRQIARGENLAEARRGLQACQKGLRLISAS